MSKEQIAIELTKIYFDNRARISMDFKKDLIDIYYFFLDNLTPKIETDPSVQVLDFSEANATTITDLSKIKPKK